MKKRIVSALIVLIIAGLSVAGGFLYTKLADKARRTEYPLLFAEEIDAAAEAAGIPSEVLYTLVSVRSGFDRNAESEDGRTGLCLLSAEEYLKYAEAIGETPDARLRWDPALNVRIGAEMLSDYFIRYNEWQAVFAAIYVGTDKADKAFSDGKTDFSLLEGKTAAFVTECSETLDKYTTLYFTESTETSAD